MSSDEPPLHDLDRLSFLTGIDHSHLSRMLAGELLPGWSHIRKLSKVVNSNQVEQFFQHERRDPTYSTTKYGRVPNGYRLLYNIPARDLRVHDLLSYRVKNDSYTPGSHWVEVESVEEKGHQRIVQAGGVSFFVSGQKPMRVARPQGGVVGVEESHDS